MKASELIASLGRGIDAYGDVEVIVAIRTNARADAAMVPVVDAMANTLQRGDNGKRFNVIALALAPPGTPVLHLAAKDIP